MRDVIDVALLDDLNRLADLAERIVGPLHALATATDYAGEFKRAFLIHQHADQIRDAGEVARYQARELVRDSKVPDAAGDTAARAGTQHAEEERIA